MSAYRARVRAARRPLWLTYHRLYAGIAQTIAEIDLPTYVVTAKDAASVREILCAAGITIDDDHIFGELRSKVAALHELARREGIEPAQISDPRRAGRPRVVAAAGVVDIFVVSAHPGSAS